MRFATMLFALCALLGETACLTASGTEPFARPDELRSLRESLAQRSNCALADTWISTASEVVRACVCGRALLCPAHQPAGACTDDEATVDGGVTPSTDSAAAACAPRSALGPADIMAVMLSHKDQLASCADLQHRTDSSRTGKLLLTWNVLTSGEVRDVSVVTREFEDTVFAKCTAGVVRTLVFPRHQQEGSPVIFPFKF